MRLLLAALAGFALAVVPALASSDEFVTATADNRFTPAEVRIAPGDVVVWMNKGFHNVRFEDGSFEYPAEPSASWQETSRVFDAAGTYGYVCEAHPGMGGTVVVEAAATTGTTTQTTGTTTQTQPAPTQTQTQTATTTTTTTTTTTPPAAPVVSVKATRSSFCVRKSRRCRRPGVVLRITSDTAHRAEGTLTRSGRAFGTVSLDLPAGTRTVRFARTSAGRRLARGRYSLEVGSAPAVRFRVR